MSQVLWGKRPSRDAKLAAADPIASGNRPDHPLHSNRHHRLLLEDLHRPELFWCPGANCDNATEAIYLFRTAKEIVAALEGDEADDVLSPDDCERTPPTPN
jgi:hypothetical protein